MLELPEGNDGTGKGESHKTAFNFANAYAIQGLEAAVGRRGRGGERIKLAMREICTNDEPTTVEGYPKVCLMNYNLETLNRDCGMDLCFAGFHMIALFSCWPHSVSGKEVQSWG